MASIPLVLSADHRSVGRFPNLALCNLYAEDAPANQGGGTSLMPTPGQSYAASAPFGLVRGMFQEPGTLDGDRLVVSGTILSRISASGTRTNLGTITGDEDCTFASDGVTVRIATGDGLYKTDGLTVTFDRSDVSSIAYLKGHWFAAEASSQLLYYLLPGDTAWDPLQVVSAEDLPDKLKAVAVNGELLELLGEKTREAWTFTGSASPPIEPYGGLTTRDSGCLSRLTVRAFNGGVGWVGADWQVWFSKGGAAQTISTEAVSERIRLAATAGETIKAWSYKQDGHEFFVLHLGDYGTWVVDARSKRWHTRKSLGYAYWRATIGIDTPEGPWIADSELETENLFALDPTVRSDNGTEVERIFCAYIEHKGKAPIPCPAVWVYCSGGDAPATGQGSEPVMVLDTSDDQGQTWSYEETAPMGILGEYDAEVEFRGLDRIKRPGRLFRFKVTDPALVRVNSVEMS